MIAYNCGPIGNAAPKRKLCNRPAEERKTKGQCKRILIRGNELKIPLEIKQLAFWGAQNELPFQGKNTPSKPGIWRKIHHLWGIFPSAGMRAAKYTLAGSVASTSRLAARSLHSFSKCPLRQPRCRSRVRLALRMLCNRVRESRYSKQRFEGQNRPGPPFHGRRRAQKLLDRTTCKGVECAALQASEEDALAGSLWRGELK
jgi:hypothetical protein